MNATGTPGPELQRYMAGAVQEVAKILALKADNQLVRQVLVHSDPADATLSWDKKVDDVRARLCTDLVSAVANCFSAEYENYKC